MTAIPVGVVASVCGVLGLMVGSFLNVVIHRAPLGRSVVRPPSSCPCCGAMIRARHNLPVLGWLLLGGKCADCQAPISVRYPLIEAGTGLVFAGIAITVRDGWILAVLLGLAAAGIALSVIDIETRRLPDRVVLPTYVIIGTLIVLAAVLEGSWGGVARAVLGGCASYVIFLAIRAGWRGGMGGGDVKLVGLLGLVMAWISWPALVVGLFAAFLLGAVVGVTLMIIGRAGRTSALPFGPFLVLGAFVGIYAGAPLAEAYLALLTGHVSG